VRTLSAAERGLRAADGVKRGARAPPKARALSAGVYIAESCLAADPTQAEKKTGFVYHLMPHQWMRYRRRLYNIDIEIAKKRPM
jgi:hypothetical protein